MDIVLNEGCAIYLITEAQLAKVVEMTVRKLSAKQEDEKRYLTSSEVSSVYGVSKTTLWRWEKANLVHPMRVGNRRRYEPSEIEKLLKQ